ncbi:hypothetical protein WKW80_21210 [Variovorax humicola]|uniref:Lactonase, 7-bladed beta-propeller n=1 Tax=Variovorax humicola TaxID=1769758 RepID=A0ABU8W4T1_9BURK
MVGSGSFSRRCGGSGPRATSLTGDCRSPRLLSSIPVGIRTDGGVVVGSAPLGHEGMVSGDGLTYYVGDWINSTYRGVDITNISKPKAIASFNMKTELGLAAHGLSVSADGNRIYATAPFNPTAADVGVTMKNGFVVLDTSEVQARKPNAKIKHISSSLYTDGAGAQHTIAVKVGGKPYMVMVDELGSGVSEQASDVTDTCSKGLTPFPMTRIFDMADETKPALCPS